MMTIRGLAAGKGAWRILALVAAVGILAVTAVVADGAVAAAPKLVTTPSWIESIAMDGRIVAYDLRAEDGCNTLHAWNVASGADVVVSGKGTCDADSTSTGAGVREIAVAGSRLAWVVNTGGNTESTDTLYRSTLAPGSEVEVASATRRGSVDGKLTGDWIGNLVGDGGLVALNRWVTPAAAAAETTIARVGSGTTTIHRGPESLRVVAADRGRVAVLDDRGLITMYDAKGAVVTSIQPAETAREVALRKDYVIAVTDGPRLVVWNASTGATVDSMPVPAGARHLDLHANIAVFAVRKTVHAIRLATKKETIIATAPRAIGDVEIDDTGLAFFFNTVKGIDDVGKLTYLPLSVVRAKLQ